MGDRQIFRLVHFYDHDQEATLAVCERVDRLYEHAVEHARPGRERRIVKNAYEDLIRGQQIRIDCFSAYKIDRIDFLE